MKPYIVLVPGAWHSADCYDYLLPHLQSAGYETLALTLPSVGAEPPIKSLDPDVDHIRSHLIPLLDQGKEVVLVMHSYGGIPGSSAVKGLSKTDRQAEGHAGGVAALVYLCAWMINEGNTTRSSGGGRGGKIGPSSLKIEDDKVTHLMPVPAFYHDVPQDIAEAAADKLRHHSEPTLTSPCQYSAHKHIPTTYLLCKNDQMIPYERQLALVESADAPLTTFTCDASHSPFLSQPELTAKVIRHASGEEVEV